MLACITARADLLVPMWIVVGAVPISTDFALDAVEGSTSFAALSWAHVVGSRAGREEVDSSCSWVAMPKLD